ncbi:uncharacterized protein [Ptychodera flava]|uniref:uncharacterized protein isoform X2 n=1 Tax=Ptychodera flava TaxID=63121 RepID=UPI003969F1C7
MDPNSREPGQNSTQEGDSSAGTIDIVTAINGLKSDLKSLEGKIATEIKNEIIQELQQLKEEMSNTLSIVRNSGNERNKAINTRSDGVEDISVEPTERIKLPKMKKRKKRGFCSQVLWGAFNNHNELVHHYKDFVKKHPKKDRIARLRRKFGNHVRFEDESEDEEVPELNFVMPFGGGYSKLGDIAGVLINLFSLVQPYLLPLVSALCSHSTVTTVMLVIQGVFIVAESVLMSRININGKHLEKFKHNLELEQLEASRLSRSLPTPAHSRVINETALPNSDDEVDATTPLLRMTDQNSVSDDDDLDDDEDESIHVPAAELNTNTITTIIS